MTLPKGFGSRGTCTDCGRPLNWGLTCKCKIKKEDPNDIIIPMSKENFGLCIWYGIFGLLVISSIFVIFWNIVFGLVLAVFMLCFSQLMAWAVLDKTKEQVYPWFIPLFNIIKRIKFTDD